MANQGLFAYAGAQSLFAASFTLSTGISPSTCTLTIAPNTSTLRQGPLELSYGGQRLRFSDCVCDRIDAEVGDDGFEVWRLTILDRRWKWKQTGRISGYYNARLDGLLREETRKTPEELIKLCLAELKEEGAKLIGIPTGVFPEVSWDYDQPAEAMAKLCDEMRLVVVLDSNDRVSIQPSGYGPPLPRLPALRAWSQTIDPPERPDDLVIAGGRVRYNAWVLLEAVGLEPDGSYKLIDELSYKPAGGWKDIDLRHFHEVDEKHRDLARRSVYRMYRIKPPFKLPGVPKEITDIQRVLPIDEEQTTKTTEDGRKFKKYAEVQGIFYNGTDDFGVWYEGKKNPDYAKLQSVLTDKFSIDGERGIVSFDEQMLVVAVGVTNAVVAAVAEKGAAGAAGAGTSTGGTYPARLWLKTGLSLRDEKTRGWTRYEYKKSLPGRRMGTPPRYVIVEDIVQEIEDDFRDGKQTTKDNNAEIQKWAEAQWKAVASEYADRNPVSAMYEGLVALSPSGAITSVSWNVSESGIATTKAAYQLEDFSLPVPTRTETRFAERARAMNARKAAARADRENARRDRA